MTLYMYTCLLYKNVCPPAALKRMLNLNVLQTKAAVPVEPVWKVAIIFLLEQITSTCSRPYTCTRNAYHSFQVLIYDKYGQDIISPLLTVKELRSLGVTLHL